MSAKHGAPAGLGCFIGAFGFGAAACAGCMAALAYLMASQGLSQTMVWPFATAAASAGSMLSGWLTAWWQKNRGLVCGAIQGLLFTAALLVLQLWNGNVPEGMQLVRLGLVFLFGCIGGFLGVLNADRKRRRR